MGANLHPREIPVWVECDPLRSAECRVFKALGETLGSDWHVFGWVGWTLLDRGRALREGEADAVVAHPELGVATLEVKGGGIFYDADARAWSSHARSGEIHAIKNPYDQAIRSRDTLILKLREHPGWRGRRISHGYGVVLPDARAMPEIPRDQREFTIFYDDMPALGEKIERMMRAWQRSDAEPLGEDGIRVLDSIVARSLDCPMPFSAVARDAAVRMERLTRDQYELLGVLSRQTRVLVEGVAGSGKTFLAFEKARRLANEGWRTLLTCFNRPLADRFTGWAAGMPGLTVASFNQLCWQWANRSGWDGPDPDGDAARRMDRDYFDRELPDRLIAAAAELGETFDAIVVDEGQDFGRAQREALLCIAKDPKQGVLYVFQDPAQRIYPDREDWPNVDMTQCVLPNNMRNTRRIHALLGRLGGHTGEARLDEGRDPELIEVRDDRERRAELSRLLHRLVEEDRFRPDQIAILATSRDDIRRIAPGDRIGKFAVTRRHETVENHVLVESVPRFKGLEREVVVLTCLRETDYMNFRASLYVGASRAQFHLAVVDTPAVVAMFRDRQESTKSSKASPE